jgi:hypothetical protein
LRSSRHWVSAIGCRNSSPDRGRVIGRRAVVDAGAELASAFPGICVLFAEWHATLAPT